MNEEVPRLIEEIEVCLSPLCSEAEKIAVCLSPFFSFIAQTYMALGDWLAEVLSEE